MLKLILAISGFVILMLVWTGWPFISNFLTATPSAADLPNKEFIIVGHRGAAGHAPENTMASFRKAIELGADWIELDVHLSKDGQLMVMHDPTVDRTTNGTGTIGDMTYDEIRALDAGSWFGESFKGEKVPALADVIREINGQVKLLIELKWPEEGRYENLGAMVADEIHKYGADKWCIIQSFESAYLTDAAAQAKDIPLQKLMVTKTSLFFMPIYQDRSFHLGSFEPGNQISSVNYFHKALTRSLIEAHHAVGKMVIPYTLNSKTDMVKALGMGVDGVITDFPDVALSLRNEL